MKNNQKVLPAKLVDEVLIRLKSGENETSIRKHIRNTLRVGKSYGNEIFRRIKNNYTTPKSVEGRTSEKDQIKNFEFEKKWFFNKEERNYIVFLKSAARAIIVDEATHNNMQRAYTSSENVKVEDICAASGFPLSLFSEYKSIFGWVRNGSHFSDEQIENNSVEDLVEDAVQHKKWEVIQESKKKIWKETEGNSKKWIEFEENYLKPFKQVVEEWKPIEVKPVKLKTVPKSGLTLVAALSDNHIGEIFTKDKSYHGREFNSEIACQIIDNYFDQIKNCVQSRSDKFSTGAIVITGDYLHSCLDGNTRKGTHLHSDKVNEDMFRIGLDTLVRFVGNFSQLFDRVRIITTFGNHESLILTYLAIAVEKHFRNNPNIQFEISDAWARLVKFGNVAALICHGGHDRIKKDLPPIGLRLKNFVQELLLAKADELAGCSQKILLSGHKHSFAQFDFGSFEFYTLGSSVLGDSYADALGLYSTPRQNCLILDENHVIETLHFYF